MKKKSFVAGADASLFSLDNLPYGVFKTAKENYRVGVAIGDYVLDLAYLERRGLLAMMTDQPLFNQAALNRFAQLGPSVWSSIRQQIQTLLAIDNPLLRDQVELYQSILWPLAETQLKNPFDIGAFTDFYASIHHASHVGSLFRGKENSLLPNWKYLPVGYHGRASTIFPTGTPIHRPHGQVKAPDATEPSFLPTQKLDFELEMGCFVGVGNPSGEPISLERAQEHIFGMVLLNDWSARDVQAFEYQPLGPFLSKSFATSISPWVVPMEALNPYLKPLPEQDPKPVGYLRQTTRQLPSIHLKVEIQARGSTRTTLLCETNLTELYWTLEQMLAHHTVNRCIMQTGDLFATGTISGSEKSASGCLLEITANGSEPIQLANGETRTFIEDGDTIIISGFCAKAGLPRIGFGSLSNTVLNAENECSS
jgi:fumarylacetoacetase